jgi:dihydrofolate reductase
MGRLIVVNSVTLDGVTQAPGRADEDPRGGFVHGGWAQPYADAVMARVLGAGMAETASGGGALLLGRRTYQDFAGYWPHQADNPFTPVLDAARKYVASRTLREPLPWRNSTLLEGEATAAVARLKRESAATLTVLGSAALVRALVSADLVDEYRLAIHPLILGAGRRLFADGGPVRALRLVEAVTTTTGVVLATYHPTERAPSAPSTPST